MHALIIHTKINNMHLENRLGESSFHADFKFYVELV